MVCGVDTEVVDDGHGEVVVPEDEILPLPLELEVDTVGGSTDELEELIANALELLLVDVGPAGGLADGAGSADEVEELTDTELELLLDGAASGVVEELDAIELELLLVDVGAADGLAASTNGGESVDEDKELLLVDAATTEVELAAAELEVPLVDAAADDELESGPTQE